MTMQRIFFIGYMGAGKTTMGKAFAAQTGLSFIDLDFFIESRYHQSVRQIFKEKSESFFREVERKILHEVADFENVIISTGGGTPCFFDNMAFMNEKGATVYLKVSVDELCKRLEYSKNTRPILENLSDKDFKQFITNALSKRNVHYEQAKIIFDAEQMLTGNDVANLCRRLKEIVFDI